MLTLSFTHPLKLQKSNKPTKQKLTAYGGSKIEYIGTVRLKCVTIKRKKWCESYIIREEADPIIGYQTCTDLGSHTSNSITIVHLKLRKAVSGNRKKYRGKYKYDLRQMLTQRCNHHNESRFL